VITVELGAFNQEGNLMGHILTNTSVIVCGRATLTKNESELEEKFGATFYSEDIERYNPIPSYNISEAQPLVYIAQNDQSHLKIGIWGWNIPMGVKTQLVINARLEEIDQKDIYSLFRLWKVYHTN
jgi:putative SOS response-associated peptidase YedK